MRQQLRWRPGKRLDFQTWRDETSAGIQVSRHGSCDKARSAPKEIFKRAPQQRLAAHANRPATEVDHNNDMCVCDARFVWVSELSKWRAVTYETGKQIEIVGSAKKSGQVARVSARQLHISVNCLGSLLLKKKLKHKKGEASHQRQVTMERGVNARRRRTLECGCVARKRTLDVAKFNFQSNRINNIWITHIVDRFL